MQLRQHLLAGGFEGVDAQVERGGLFAGERQGFGLGFAQLGGEALVEPIGQVEAHRCGQVFGTRRFDALDQFHFRGLQDRLELPRIEAGEARQRGQRHRTRRTRAGHFAERAAIADHAVGSLGSDAALERADLGIGAKVV